MIKPSRQSTQTQADVQKGWVCLCGLTHYVNDTHKCNVDRNTARRMLASVVWAAGRDGEGAGVAVVAAK